MFKAIHNYRENGGLINISQEPDRRPYERLLGEFTGLRPETRTVRECDEHTLRETARARKIRMVRA